MLTLRFQLLLSLTHREPLVNYKLHFNMNLLTVSGRDVDERVTAIVVVAILFMEVVQFLVVNFSDWAKVQWL